MDDVAYLMPVQNDSQQQATHIDGMTQRKGDMT